MVTLTLKVGDEVKKNTEERITKLIRGNIACWLKIKKKSIRLKIKKMKGKEIEFKIITTKDKNPTPLLQDLAEIIISDSVQVIKA
ncbi:MAG: hypothetical protein U9R00_00440 [Patescibacteria group bacterium]|nr:hypothetical protein [Patescibacteria group bacterium]